MEKGYIVVWNSQLVWCLWHVTASLKCVPGPVIRSISLLSKLTSDSSRNWDVSNRAWHIAVVRIESSSNWIWLNLIVPCELERDTQTANFALLQIDWCCPAPCLRRLLLLVCCSVAFDAIEVWLWRCDPLRCHSCAGNPAGQWFAGPPILQILLRQASLPLHGRSSSSLSSWCWVWPAVSDSSSQAAHALRLPHPSPSRSPVLLGHLGGK